MRAFLGLFLALLVFAPGGVAAQEYLTDEEFDAGLAALQQKLTVEHQVSPERIRARMGALHDEFHGAGHSAKLIPGKAPPQGSVPVTKVEMDLLTDTADAKLALIAVSIKARRGQAAPEEVLKARARFEQSMDAFMKAPSPLHDAYHKSYRQDPDGDNGLGGLPQDYQRDHNRRMRDNDPQNPFPLVFSGNAALADGNPAAAKAFASRALALDPKNADAYSLRAAAEMGLKDHRAASADAKQALELDPGDQRSQAVVLLAHDRVADGFAVKRPGGGGQGGGVEPAAAGVSSAKAAVSIANGALQSDALARQAERAMALGDYGTAIAQASRAASLDPGNGLAFALRAMANLRAGDHEGALKDAAAALSLDAENPLALNARAGALNRAGNYRDALAAADAAIRANPGNARAYYMKAMALDGLDDRAGMKAALEQAAAHDARYAAALEIARQAPEDQDLSFLFPEEQLAAAKAALASNRQDPPGGISTAAIVIGAGLILFGLAHLLLSGLYARAARTGPSVGRSETILGLPTPLPLSGGQREEALLRGQFRVLRALGAGPRGAVFVGLDVSLDRRVVIRRLPAPLRADDRRRTLGPARLAASLSHPGVASLYSVVEEADEIYLVVELAEGKSLKEVLGQGGAMPAAQALALFRKIAEALDYAHARGIAHGAIRPSNIVIGSDGQPKLVDFGLAPGNKGKAADLQDFASCLRQTLGVGALSAAVGALSASALIDALADSDASPAA